MPKFDIDKDKHIQCLFRHYLMIFMFSEVVVKEESRS